MEILEEDPDEALDAIDEDVEDKPSIEAIDKKNIVLVTNKKTNTPKIPSLIVLSNGGGGVSGGGGVGGGAGSQPKGQPSIVMYRKNQDQNHRAFRAGSSESDSTMNTTAPNAGHGHQSYQHNGKSSAFLNEDDDSFFQHQDGCPLKAQSNRVR